MQSDRAIECKRGAPGAGSYGGGAEAGRSALQRAGSLPDVGRDGIHQWRAQAVVGLEAELFEPATHFTHARRIETLLDDRGHEGRKLRFAPALIGGQLGMHEIQAVERMAGILDAAEHMYAAALAGGALNGGLRI